MDEAVVRLVMDQMADVQAQHPQLALLLAPSGKLLVSGVVAFSINHDGQTVEDSYQVELAIPEDYPDAPPTARETAGAIPSDFHRFRNSGDLCLGAPVEVRRRFAQHRDLLRFINDQLVPYLFSHSYHRDHGKLPFGELPHGSAGLLTYYGEFLGTSGVATLKLLKLLADGSAASLEPCPCGSGQKLRDCHGVKLNALAADYSPEQFETELREMVRLAMAAGIPVPERDVMPERLWRNREKRRRRKTRRR